MKNPYRNFKNTLNIKKIEPPSIISSIEGARVQGGTRSDWYRVYKEYMIPGPPSKTIVIPVYLILLLVRIRITGQVYFWHSLFYVSKLPIFALIFTNISLVPHYSPFYQWPVYASIHMWAHSDHSKYFSKPSLYILISSRPHLFKFI